MIPLADLLPESNPKNVADRHNRRYFYKNVLKQLIEPTVDLMMQGITVDHTAIEELKVVIDNVLVDVDQRLADSSIIEQFRKHRYTELAEKKKQELISKQRNLDYYMKPYKPTDLVMRSYVVNEYLKIFEDNDFKLDLSFFPEDILPNGETKWSVNDIKKFRANNAMPELDNVIAKLPIEDFLEARAMTNLAVYKARTYNVSYETQIDEIDLSIVPQFKPGSSQQKAQLFSFLKIPCEAQTDAGADSWSRDEITRVNKSTSDQSIKDLTQIFIDHSMSKIIRSNFLAAFDTYIVDGRLHGNYRLGGAKSMRYTSNSPNMLNAPSTGSLYAKPLKKCFVAPDGFLVAAIDYAALEDRVIANLSGDVNKIKVFKDNIDGHSLASTYYYPEKIAEFIGPFTDNAQAAKDFKKVTKTNKEAKALRQESKGNTFKLAYQGFPDAHKGGTITQEIFDNYHTKMYPGIAEFRDEVIAISRTEGHNYLGMGFCIRSEDVDTHMRTLFNASSQFWSILTALSVAQIRLKIKECGYSDDIKITSTIYDSIYFEVRKDAKVIKWLNTTLVPILTKDFLHNQEVHNEANLEIGTSWADVEDIELPNNCSEEYIQNHLDSIK